jgi:hypothetical protein
MEYIKMKITKFFYKGYIIDLEISEKEGYKKFAELYIAKENSGIKSFMVGFGVDDIIKDWESIEVFFINFIQNEADGYIDCLEDLLEEIDG